MERLAPQQKFPKKGGDKFMNKRKQPTLNQPNVEQISTYLWDGSGEVDSEIVRLEKALAQFRHSGDTPNLSDVSIRARPGFLAPLLRIVWVPRLAAVTVIALAICSGIVLLFFPAGTPISPPGWQVARVDGTPLVGTTWTNASRVQAMLHVGQTLVTNRDSRATISVAEIGEIQVEPGSRIRLLQSTDNRKRIALDRGTILAAIWAPPGEFVVDTPSAVAVDLGCAYTLQVAPDGSGILRTTLGWVGFHLDGRDSFIPAGAMCPTRRGVGPGTPYFEDAPGSFREALRVLDFGSSGAESRGEALHTILQDARKKDALTLWHLLSRTQGEERAEVFDRLAALVPPPAGVAREGVLRLDQPMLDLWWNALDLGDISIWRFWEQSPASGTLPAKEALRKKQMLLQKSR